MRNLLLTLCFVLAGFAATAQNTYYELINNGDTSLFLKTIEVAANGLDTTVSTRYLGDDPAVLNALVNDLLAQSANLHTKSMSLERQYLDNETSIESADNAIDGIISAINGGTLPRTKNARFYNSLATTYIVYDVAQDTSASYSLLMDVNNDCVFQNDSVPSVEYVVTIESPVRFKVTGLAGGPQVLSFGLEGTLPPVTGFNRSLYVTGNRKWQAIRMEAILPD